MRKIIILLSVIFFTLSGTITFKALTIPAGFTGYRNTPETTAPKELPPEPVYIPDEPATDKTDNNDLVEQLQATITELEDELARKDQEARTGGEPESPEEKPRVLAVLGAGMFRSGQITINEDRSGAVKELIPDIMAFPDHHVVVEGHTDSIPISSASGRQFKDNMDLSFLRAKAVAGIFFENGISPERVSVIGYGDTRPIAPNETEEGRVRNRRVEVKLVPGEKGP